MTADGIHMTDRATGDPAQSTTDPRFEVTAAQYRVLREQVDAGNIPPEQLDRSLRALAFESGGRFWMIGANSGAWYASDGQSWVRATGLRAVGGTADPPAWATHYVPAQGAWAWTAPDPDIAPTTKMDPWLEVRVIELRADGWAHIECTNSWTAWVDGRVLLPLDA